MATVDVGLPRISTDASVYTVAATTGTWCVEVAECNAILGPGVCSPAASITNSEFVVVFFEDAATTSPEAEPNNAAANASAFMFTESPTEGRYFLMPVWGRLTDGDVDFMKFTVPAKQVIAQPPERILRLL